MYSGPVPAARQRFKVGKLTPMYSAASAVFIVPLNNAEVISIPKGFYGITREHTV